MLALLFSWLPLTRLSRAEERLRYLAKHDALTGQLNRQAADALFETEARRARRYGLRLSVLILDADRFKRINKERGHAAGDRTLRRLAALLDANLRSRDHSVRLSGEESLIIATHTDTDAGYAMTEKLRRLVKQADFHVGKPVTISIGVCECGAAEHLRETASYAHSARCRAKAGGRNRVEIADGVHGGP